MVVLSGDEVLLVQRAKAPKPAEWSLPGGAQDVGETLKAAAQREVKEETGLDVTAQGLIDVIDFIERDDAGKARFHYSLIDFWGQTDAKNASAGDDAAAVRWVRLEDVDTLPLWDETKRVIHMAVKMRDDAQHGR